MANVPTTVTQPLDATGRPAVFDGAYRGRRLSWAEFYKLRPDLRPDNDNPPAGGYFRSLRRRQTGDRRPPKAHKTTIENMTPMKLELELARTAAARRKAERDATQLIAANDNTPPKSRVRYRGGRPAWNWLAKQDARAAALLWLAARQMLPDADNDNREPGLKHLDRRKDGRPRGAKEPEFNAGSYLALPPIRPRLGDAERQPVRYVGWHNAAGFAIRPQRPDMPFADDCRFGFCAPGVAWQYGSLIETVGKPRPGKSRGDVRRVEEPDLPDLPDDVFVTVEAMLSGATLAGVGEMHGARGGYADRRGKQAMLAAGAWALSVIDAPETRRAA